MTFGHVSSIFSLGSELVFNDVMFHSLFLQLCSFPFYSVVFIILFLSSHISELLVFLCVCFGASLVVQLKNPTAMWETWVQSLGWENLLEKGKATDSSILAWRIPWTV